MALNATPGAGATECGAVINNATLGTALANDNCSGVTVSRSGVPAGNLFPVGITTITYKAVDASGNMRTATQKLTIVDNTPPTITLDASKPVDPSVIWPPNKNMILVTVNYTTRDNCDSAPAPVLSVSSNEGTSVDWEIIDAVT